MSERQERKVRFSQTLRILLVVLLVVVVALFAAANSQRVEVDWLVDSTTSPMYVLVGASAGVGLVVGLLLGARRRAS